MNVRGWLMVGPPEATRGLPPAATAGMAQGLIPDAMAYDVGVWVLWQPAPGQAPIAIVCVEIPI